MMKRFFSGSLGPSIHKNIKEWLHQKKMKVLLWPTRGAELNLTENLRIHLKLAVDKRRPHNVGFGEFWWKGANDTKPRMLTYCDWRLDVETEWKVVSTKHLSQSVHLYVVRLLELCDFVSLFQNKWTHTPSKESSHTDQVRQVTMNLFKKFKKFF